MLAPKSTESKAIATRLCRLMLIFTALQLCLLTLPHLQEAAGAFVTLRDGPSLKVEQPRPNDISPECAAMLEKLCLAQAQECTFEKARQDKKNPAVLAR